jgi:hypothetical protein
LARLTDSHPTVLAQKSSRNGHNPKTEVVVPVVRLEVATSGRAAIVGIVVPTTTAQHSEVPAPSSLSCKDKGSEYLLSELPGIAIFQVGFPAL